MKSLIIALLGMCFFCTQASAQTVYGALAIDRNNGFYYGWAYDYASLSGAENRALKECKAKGGNCEVVVTWEGQGCAVYRTIPGNVGTAYGWGVAQTQSEADAIATREALKRSKGVEPTNYVWACNSVGGFKELSNEATAVNGNPPTASKPVTKRIFKDDDGDEYEYEGDLQNNLPHGQGKQTYIKSGSVYVGQFKNGEQDGTGTITWKSGSTYTGGFKNGKMQGRGTYKWASGSIYIGELQDSKMHGYGTWTSSIGTYEGSFKNGKMHGQGTLTANVDKELVNTPKTTKYVGAFENGDRNGYGKCYNKNGQLIYSGNFSNDKPTAQYPQ